MCFYEGIRQKRLLFSLSESISLILFPCLQVRQEEIVPESKPPTEPETDTVTKIPIAEHIANDVPKRVDSEKEPSQSDDVMRKDKPERKDKKEFSKYSGPSRGPRRPVDKTRNRSGEEKFKHYEQRRTDKKRPTACDRPESAEQEDKDKESAKEPDKQGSDFALWAETKPDGTRSEMESEKKSSVTDTPGKEPGKEPGKDEKGVTGRGNNIKSSQNSYGERPRSARRGRGRSGRGKPSTGSANESRDGVRNVNKSRTFGEVVKRPEVTGPLENRKLPFEKNGRPQAQNNSRQENSCGEEGRASKTDKVCKPPPGFENFQADKGGGEQSTNGHRLPPWFKQHSTRPRPPPGLGNLAEGPGQNTSQSIAS